MAEDASLAVGWTIAAWVFIAFGVWLNARILSRAGRSPLWAALFLFPLAWLVGLWVFAFTRWPKQDAVPLPPRSKVDRQF